MARSRGRVSDQTFKVPAGTPDDVVVRDQPREPTTDPTVGIHPALGFEGAAEPPHRLVVIGDSLSHGFQSGAIYNTDISYPAIIAHELGWFDQFRFPRYGGPGRPAAQRRVPPARPRASLRGGARLVGAAGCGVPRPPADGRDRGLLGARTRLGGAHDQGRQPQPVRLRVGPAGRPRTDLTPPAATACRTRRTTRSSRWWSGNAERAAVRVYPSEFPQDTVFDAAARLRRRRGQERPRDRDPGGVPRRQQRAADRHEAQGGLEWSRLPEAGRRRGKYTVWTPTHFRAELAAVVEQVKKINARHVIWCTASHVTVGLRSPAASARRCGRAPATSTTTHGRGSRPRGSRQSATRASPATMPASSTRRSTSTTTTSSRSSRRRGRKASGPVARATGTCSTWPASSTGWRPAATSRTSTRAPTGGRRTRSRRSWRH